MERKLIKISGVVIASGIVATGAAAATEIIAKPQQQVATLDAQDVSCTESVTTGTTEPTFYVGCGGFF